MRVEKRAVEGAERGGGRIRGQARGVGLSGRSQPRILQGMQEDQPSQTALSAAALRAAHRVHDRDLVFDDFLAADFTSDEWRERLAAGTVGPLIEELGLRRVQGQLVGRARYVEDALERAVAAGIRQYVLLGAGLDSFAWRRPDLVKDLCVVELDHPATQHYKRQRLVELDRPVPKGLRLAPIDFERTSVDAVLRSTDFDPWAPACFSWMGVVGYLTRDGFEASLQSVAAVAAPGSELLFDYPIALELVGQSDRALVRRVDEGTAELGERRHLKQRPADVSSAASAFGFETLEDLSPGELQERYFSGRDDGLAPNPEVHITRLERQPG